MTTDVGGENAKKKKQRKKETVQLLRKKKKNNEKKRAICLARPFAEVQLQKKKKSFFPFVVCDIEELPKTVFHVRRHEWYMFERRSRRKKKHKMKGYALPPHYSTQHDTLSTGIFSFPFLKHNPFF